MIRRRYAPLAIALVSFCFSGIASAARAQAQAPDWPASRPPRALPSRPLAFPPYELKTLANGLQVLVIPQHEEPSVSFRLIIRAGAAQDPNGKPGVAGLVSALLDQGTTTKSSEAIADTIESAGGVLGTGTGNELSSINAAVVKDRFDMLLDLASDIAQHPAFAADEIDRQRQRALSTMEVSDDDPSYIADSVFDRLVYGAHPYGQPASGTRDSIARITRDDLVAFHHVWFVPNNALLAIVGDISNEEAFAAAERAFGKWEKHDVPTGAPAPPPDPKGRVVIIDRPGAVQTEIRVGQLGIPRADPNYVAVDMAIRILGGEGANRLFNILRTEHSLTYGASADNQTYKYAGDFVAQTNTRSSATGETLRLMVDEFWRLTRERVDPRELQGAQEYLAGSFPLTIETPSQIAQQVLNRLFYGLDLKDLETFRDQVDAATVDDVFKASKQFVKPDRLSIVLVGDASAFIDQLKAVGFPDVERIPIADLDITSPNLRKSGKSTEVAPAPLPDAHDIIAKAVQAKGGLDRLKKVQTVEVQANVTVDGPTGPVAVKTHSFIAYPDHFRIEVESPAGMTAQVFAGKDAWIENKGGVADAAADDRDDFHAATARDVLLLLLGASEGRIDARQLPDETLDGQPVAAVRLQPTFGGPVTMLVDRATGDVRGMRYPALNKDNSPIAVEMYGDFRDVDGVRIAFHTRVEREGSVVDRVVTTAHINGAIAAGVFTRHGE